MCTQSATLERGNERGHNLPDIMALLRVVRCNRRRQNLGDNMTGRTVAPPYKGSFPNRARTKSGTFNVHEYTLTIPMKDASAASFAVADQIARTMTYDPEQQFTSDRLFQVPPDAMHGRGEKALRRFHLNLKRLPAAGAVVLNRARHGHSTAA